MIDDIQNCLGYFDIRVYGILPTLSHNGLFKTFKWALFYNLIIPKEWMKNDLPWQIKMNYCLHLHNSWLLSYIILLQKELETAKEDLFRPESSALLRWVKIMNGRVTYPTCVLTIICCFCFPPGLSCVLRWQTMYFFLQKRVISLH